VSFFFQYSTLHYSTPHYSTPHKGCNEPDAADGGFSEMRAIANAACGHPPTHNTRSVNDSVGATRCFF
jgi:hypothetical protein